MSQSANLNPALSMWSMLKSSLVECRATAASGLMQTLEKAWMNLLTDLPKKLVWSTPARMHVFIQTKGGRTQY